MTTNLDTIKITEQIRLIARSFKVLPKDMKAGDRWFSLTRGFVQISSIKKIDADRYEIESGVTYNAIKLSADYEIANSILKSEGGYYSCDIYAIINSKYDKEGVITRI